MSGVDILKEIGYIIVKGVILLFLRVLRLAEYSRSLFKKIAFTAGYLYYGLEQAVIELIDEQEEPFDRKVLAPYLPAVVIAVMFLVSGALFSEKDRLLDTIQTLDAPNRLMEAGMYACGMIAIGLFVAGTSEMIALAVKLLSRKNYYGFDKYHIVHYTTGNIMFFYGAAMCFLISDVSSVIVCGLLRIIGVLLILSGALKMLLDINFAENYEQTI